MHTLEFTWDKAAHGQPSPKLNIIWPFGWATAWHNLWRHTLNAVRCFISFLKHSPAITLTSYIQEGDLWPTVIWGEGFWSEQIRSCIHLKWYPCRSFKVGTCSRLLNMLKQKELKNLGSRTKWIIMWSIKPFLTCYGDEYPQYSQFVVSY